MDDYNGSRVDGEKRLTAELTVSYILDECHLRFSKKIIKHVWRYSTVPQRLLGALKSRLVDKVLGYLGILKAIGMETALVLLANHALHGEHIVQLQPWRTLRLPKRDHLFGEVHKYETIAERVA